MRLTRILHIPINFITHADPDALKLEMILKDDTDNFFTASDSFQTILHDTNSKPSVTLTINGEIIPYKTSLDQEDAEKTHQLGIHGFNHNFVSVTTPFFINYYAYQYKKSFRQLIILAESDHDESKLFLAEMNLFNLVDDAEIDGAIELLESIKKQTPMTRLYLALSYLKKQDDEQAIKLLYEIVLKDRKFEQHLNFAISCLTVLAYTYPTAKQHLKEYEESQSGLMENKIAQYLLEITQKLCQENPNNEETKFYFHLASFYNHYRLNKIDLAIDHLLQASQLNSDKVVDLILNLQPEIIEIILPKLFEKNPPLENLYRTKQLHPETLRIPSPFFKPPVKTDESGNQIELMPIKNPKPK